MKMTYALIKKMIAKGETDPEELKNKMDIFLVAGRLTEKEYNDLTAELNAE